MGNYTRLYEIQDDVLAGVAVLAAEGSFYLVLLRKRFNCERKAKTARFRAVLI